MCDVVEKLYNLLRCSVENLGGINDTTISKGGIQNEEKKKASEKKKPQHTLKEKRQLKKEKTPR